MLPDADAAVGLLVSSPDRLSSFHNQATHSILFALVASAVLSAAGRLFFRSIPLLRLFAWTLLLLGSHLLLDWLTWGRGEPLLWPFTDRRFGSPFPLFSGVRYSEGLFSRSHLFTLLTESATLCAAAAAWAAWRHFMRSRGNGPTNMDTTPANPSQPPDAASFKTKSLREGSAFAAYRRMQYGPAGLGYILWAEFLALFVGPLPGALGLVLRKWLYPSLFKACGHGVIFGRNLTLRHARKITLGDGVVLDDNVVLDAKGDTNHGIDIGNGVFIGRNTIVYCKNGDIRIGDRANISSNCQVFSGHSLEIGPGTVVAAYVYLLSGGNYDTSRAAPPFADQLGLEVRGPTVVGENNWIGAGAVILDGIRTGSHAVIGAGAVVTSDIPPDTLAAGVPARPKRSLA
jgi:acetyltransferase-like isoleucine patch superfamily enzyme/membrane-bound metal-dependent hydrolase YbcI (DUF457 family)